MTPMWSPWLNKEKLVQALLTIANNVYILIPDISKPRHQLTFWVVSCYQCCTIDLFNIYNLSITSAEYFYEGKTCDAYCWNLCNRYPCNKSPIIAQLHYWIISINSWNILLHTSSYNGQNSTWSTNLFSSSKCKLLYIFQA